MKIQEELLQLSKNQEKKIMVINTLLCRGKYREAIGKSDEGDSRRFTFFFFFV